ncbi:MAG: alpha/beta fold hydrolase [candidate division Zixibacteria bacterium]
MTKKTKEAIKASMAIVIAVVAVLALWIYPLIQSGKIISRPEIEGVSEKSDSGLNTEPFTIMTEDNLKLVCYFMAAQNENNGASDSALGTVIVLHGLSDDLSSRYEKARHLTDAGFNVFYYDQRAFGESEGDYRSGGYFESNDLQTVISRLYLEDKIIEPLIIWGKDQGGTAAIRIWENESRIDFVIAEEPIIDGRDWQKREIARRDLSIPDFYLGFIWWWMKQKSGYEIDIEETDISDQFGMATEFHPDNFLLIASGENDIPQNESLAELRDIGGKWMILPEAEEDLINANSDRLMNAFVELVKSKE